MVYPLTWHFVSLLKYEAVALLSYDWRLLTVFLDPWSVLMALQPCSKFILRWCSQPHHLLWSRDVPKNSPNRSLKLFCLFTTKDWPGHPSLRRKRWEDWEKQNTTKQTITKNNFPTMDVLMPDPEFTLKHSVDHWAWKWTQKEGRLFNFVNNYCSKSLYKTLSFTKVYAYSVKWWEHFHFLK